ncbi:hypothetical protein EJB05_47636, partial [Eragrostis curvula]
MAMRSAAALVLRKLRTAEVVYGSGLGGGGGTKVLLFGSDMRPFGSLPAIVRAAEAAASGSRRFSCGGGDGGLREDGNKGIVDKKNLKREGLPGEHEVGACGTTINNCLHTKILELQNELKLEKALAAQRKEYEEKLSAMRTEYEGKLSALRIEFESKLRAAQNEWRVEFNGLKLVVDKVTDICNLTENKSTLVTNNYEHFKESFELRVQSIQYNIVKVVAGVATFGGGTIATYFKLKEELQPRLTSMCVSPDAQKFFGKDWWD